MTALRIGRYRILQRLGGGGSADVYTAEDTLLRRKVAIKVLRGGEADERKWRHYEREARCASMLNHPNILTIFDVGRDGEHHYIVTELVDGETLRERLERGPVSFLEAVEIAHGVATALTAAHEAWVVHRDVKPENIAVRKDRVVKVLDFGVSAFSGDGDHTDPVVRAGDLVGTLPYLSPEQVRGESIIDTRSDIYSLGVVLYEMLGGDVPFRGTSVMEILAAIVEQEPAPLPAIVPESLRDLVSRMLRKNMYERPQTAADLAAELDAIRFALITQDRGADARLRLR